MHVVHLSALQVIAVAQSMQEAADRSLTVRVGIDHGQLKLSVASGTWTPGIGSATGGPAVLIDQVDRYDAPPYLQTQGYWDVVRHVGPCWNDDTQTVHQVYDGGRDGLLIVDGEHVVADGEDAAHITLLPGATRCVVCRGTGWREVEHGEDVPCPTTVDRYADGTIAHTR